MFKPFFTWTIYGNKQTFIVPGTGLLITMSIAWLQWHMLLSCQDKSTKMCCPQDLLEGLVQSHSCCKTQAPASARIRYHPGSRLLALNYQPQERQHSRASPGNTLKIKIIQPYRRSTRTSHSGDGPSKLCFNKPFRRVGHTPLRTTGRVVKSMDSVATCLGLNPDCHSPMCYPGQVTSLLCG